jgi:hypothetical protein
MKFKQFTNYLLEHRLRAVLLLFGFSFLPVVGMLGTIYAGLVTLRKGAMDGAIMTAVTILPYILGFILAINDPHAQIFILSASIGVVVLTNVATCVFAVMLYRQMTWSGIIQVAALAGVLVISIIYIVFPDINAWWSAQLAIAAKFVNSGLPAANDVFGNLIAKFTNLLILLSDWGVIIASILMNAVMLLIMARYWQAAVFAPGMLRRELHNIRLSSMAGVLFMLSIMLSRMGNNVVQYMMPTLGLLFVGAGLSVIHYFFGLMKSPMRMFWITLMYVSLLIYGLYGVVLLVIIALLDIWLDLRRKLRKI